jgi:hypothetical protein
MACKWNAIDELGFVLVFGAILFWTKPTRSRAFAQCSDNLRQAGIAWFAVAFLVVPGLVYALTFWPLFRSQRIPFSAAEVFAANAYIWRFHRAVIGNVGLITPWYRWPLTTQPTRALSYLVGNWFVMFAGLAALLFCLRRFARTLPETLIVSLYAVNMLQWAFTPQSCTFYYYYFPPPCSSAWPSPSPFAAYRRTILECV